MARNLSRSDFASSPAVIATLSILALGNCGAAPQSASDLPARPAALARLAPLAGEWEGSATIRATQWTTGATSSLSAAFRWILGERHLEGTLRYTVGDKPFECRIVVSFDSLARLYRAHWVDNFSSEALTFSGKFMDERTLTLTATRKQDSQVVTEKLRLGLLPTGAWELSSSSDASGDMTELARLAARRKK